MSDKYALIIEHKAEEPLLWEQVLSAGDYETVARRMDSVINDPRIIRVCMVKLVYETGNKAVLE